MLAAIKEESRAVAIAIGIPNRIPDFLALSEQYSISVPLVVCL
jgi:hypothetical protein